MKNKYFIIGILACCFFSEIKAQCWSPLGTGFKAYGNVFAMINYNGKLIVAGQFESIGGIAANNIASWDGSNWSNLGSGVSARIISQILALAVYNGELYATGIFDSAGGIPAQNIAKWNGLSWSAVGSGPIIPSDELGRGGNSLAVYNGQLYAGWVSNTADTLNGIARWNGISWSDVGGGIRRDGNPGGVWSLATDNGLLYASGNFDSAGTVQANNIAVWNDTAWSALGNRFVCSCSEFVPTISFCSGHLYAIGDFTTIDTIYEWDGAAWNAIASEIIPLPDADINSFYDFNGSLLVGGGFSYINGISANCLAQWNGTNWSDFSEGLGLYPNAGGFVSSMCEYNGDLYAGGGFASRDSLIIARYTCATAGIADIRNAENLTIYPNPVTDILYITNPLPNASYTVMDMAGRICAVSAVNQVDVSALPAGVYCLRVQDSGRSVVRKFAKE